MACMVRAVGTVGTVSVGAASLQPQCAQAAVGPHVPRCASSNADGDEAARRASIDPSSSAARYIAVTLPLHNHYTHRPVEQRGSLGHVGLQAGRPRVAGGDALGCRQGRVELQAGLQP